MDQRDRRILELLQKDATLTAAELAEKVGLTTTPCWRRIQRLERDGYIRSRVRAGRHSADWLQNFKRALGRIPEIVEAHRLSGDVDYLLRVVVPDIDGYDAVYKRLIQAVEFSDVSSSFSMEELKFTTALPVEHAG